MHFNLLRLPNDMDKRFNIKQHTAHCKRLRNLKNKYFRFWRQSIPYAHRFAWELEQQKQGHSD
jgi:hypothetical protein